MNGKVGDRLVIESEKVGVAARQGEILEVMPHEYGNEFRVRWDDGHESSIRPAAGSGRIVPAGKATRGKATAGR